MLYQLWLVGQISYDNKVPFPRISGESGAVCLQTFLSPEYSVIFGLAAVVSLGSVKGMQSLRLYLHVENQNLCDRLNVCAPQNPYVENLMPNVMLSGDGTFRR